MKPIVKYELKKGVSIAIILSIMNVFVLINQYKSLISLNAGGYVSLWEDEINSVIYLINPRLILVGIIAMSILVSMQFKEDKDSGTENFLAGLPYTNKQRFYNKIMVGAMTVGIVYIVSVITMYVLKGEYAFYQNILYRNSSYEEELRQITSFGSLSLILLYIHIGLFVYYLFLTMLQYMIKGSKAAVVIGTLSFISIPYILFGVVMYFECMLNIEFRHAYGLAFTYRQVRDTCILVSERCLRVAENIYMYIGDGIVENYISRFIILILVAIIIFIIAKMFVEKYGFINHKTLFVNRCTEIIFRIGVTVCGALMPLYISVIILGRIMPEYLNQNQNCIIVTICMIITGAISYFISSKIAKGGKN